MNTCAALRQLERHRIMSVQTVGHDMNMNRLNKKLQKDFGGKVRVREEENKIVVSGSLSSWADVIRACNMCVSKDRNKHVVNEIEFTGAPLPPMALPAEKDDELEGARPDVLIIGGGISGASIARELSKWKLTVLLVEKEADFAIQASGRNDGEVHPGVDLNKGSLKQHYVLAGNKMYDKICWELDVPFKRCGQYVGFNSRLMYPVVWLYAWQRRNICGVTDTVLLGEKELRKREPGLGQGIRFAMYNRSAGCVCPYGLTIAYGENAAANGAKISFNTAVLSMELEEGRIKSVLTNRGRLYPKLVINAAGTFAEDVAQMAGDRFYSIHPRRGTNSILDKSAASMTDAVVSVKLFKKSRNHTKGGGVLHTVDDNILVGPNAVETWEKENFATEQVSIDEVFSKQKNTIEALSQKDIITYFTGVRAAAFEEDFIIEKGRETKNLIHCAGIQSPGLTTAPAVALDIEKMAVEMLREEMPVEKNQNFNPVRKGIPRVRELSLEERNKLIEKNPDYGVIVCRCEEISKGEIIDALHSPVPVCTIDGIKKRLRPGMGRCQGGFCQPLVAKIISEELGIPVSEVRKAGKESVITYGRIK